MIVPRTQLAVHNRVQVISWYGCPGPGSLLDASQSQLPRPSRGAWHVFHLPRRRDTSFCFHKGSVYFSRPFLIVKKRIKKKKKGTKRRRKGEKEENGEKGRRQREMEWSEGRREGLERQEERHKRRTRIH